jgi:hypothetical protein
VTLGDHRAVGGCAPRSRESARPLTTRGRAVRSGIRRYVVLGAGLDTFVHRCELAGQVRVFEVDRRAALWNRQGALVPLDPSRIVHARVRGRMR